MDCEARSDGSQSHWASQWFAQPSTKDLDEVERVFHKWRESRQINMIPAEWRYAGHTAKQEAARALYQAVASQYWAIVDLGARAE